MYPEELDGTLNIPTDIGKVRVGRVHLPAPADQTVAIYVRENNGEILRITAWSAYYAATYVVEPRFYPASIRNVIYAAAHRIRYHGERYM